MNTRTAYARVRTNLSVRSTGGRSPAGVPLPPVQLRMGGKHFVDNAEFVRTATRDVDRLAGHGLSRESRLIDWGCGAGRLAVGILERWGGIARYDGIDVQKHLVGWANRNLASDTVRFQSVDVANARYNLDGSPERYIPGKTGDYDALYGYSVLSHMDSAEVVSYLAEIRRLIKPGGFAWVTAFVEDDVPDETVNPARYGFLAWRGALHCVRFSRRFFEAAVCDADLSVDHFEHGRETDGQSLYVLR
jgi:SAM-dependent methyltransferase